MLNTGSVVALVQPVEDVHVAEIQAGLDRRRQQFGPGDAASRAAGTG
jgi:hypothetical protein